MGHVKFGKLPTSRKWKDVVAHLVATDVNVAGLADAVFKATKQALARAAGDAAFVEVCWLLNKVPQAAKLVHINAALTEIGTIQRSNVAWQLARSGGG